MEAALTVTPPVSVGFGASDKWKQTVISGNVNVADFIGTSCEVVLQTKDERIYYDVSIAQGMHFL